MDTTSPALAEQPLTERMWQEVIAQLRGFVRRRIADPDRADDRISDILLRIHQNLGSVDDQGRMTHWVSRMARNAVIDEYRRIARAREQFLTVSTDTTAIDPVEWNAAGHRSANDQPTFSRVGSLPAAVSWLPEPPASSATST